MPRWGPAHRKALVNLFEAGTANPEHTKCDDIDPVIHMDPLFSDVPIGRFLDNYKNCATEYMMGQALDGVRRSEFLLST
jgi:hypothetical protein